MPSKKIKKIVSYCLLIIFILITIYLTYLLLRTMYEYMIYAGWSLFSLIFSVLMFWVIIIYIPLLITFLLFSIKNHYIKIFTTINISAIAIILICGCIIFPIHKTNVKNQIANINKLAIEKGDKEICNNINKLYWFKQQLGKDRREMEKGYPRENEFEICIKK